MRIAQVSPLYESVPPKLYGGTERVVYWLVEELVRQGHDVTLFASGDSVTSARRLVAPCHTALRLDPNVKEPLAHHYIMLDQVFEEAASFDVIHFHIGYLHFPLARRYGAAQITTLHGRLDISDLIPLYKRFSDMGVVSISDYQRRYLPWANWLGTVHHGLPLDLYSCAEPKGEYLAFLGRISPEKGLDRAIEIATRAGMKLRVAAKIDAADREYFQAIIRPLLDNPLVECIGEINDQGKQEFLGNAYALMFSIDWPEPFGLVLIEAMACGTPVVAFGRGSVPELIEDGVTGFIVDNVEQAVAALPKIRRLDRSRCRQVFEQRFSVTRMTDEYLKVYQRAIEDQRAADADMRGAISNFVARTSDWQVNEETAFSPQPPAGNRLGLVAPKRII
jgi:glycosyltransferase involved in cell wall biosynthesis